jgi:hypothetical protein
MQAASGEKNGCWNTKQNWLMECRRFFSKRNFRVLVTGCWLLLLMLALPAEAREGGLLDTGCRLLTSPDS